MSNRKQKVAINSFYYESADIESVYQESVLGPLIFFYINDLENDIKSNAKFFAEIPCFTIQLNILIFQHLS